MVSPRARKWRYSSVPPRRIASDTDSINSAAQCFVGHEAAPRSALVRIPCCDYLTHQKCVDDGTDAFCPCCDFELRDTLDIAASVQCSKMRHSCAPDATGDEAFVMFSCCAQFPYQLRCLVPLVQVVHDVIPCPRCLADRRDFGSRREVPKILCCAASYGVFAPIGARQPLRSWSPFFRFFLQL